MSTQENLVLALNSLKYRLLHFEVKLDNFMEKVNEQFADDEDEGFYGNEENNKQSVQDKIGNFYFDKSFSDRTFFVPSFVLIF